MWSLILTLTVAGQYHNYVIDHHMSLRDCNESLALQHYNAQHATVKIHLDYSCVRER